MTVSPFRRVLPLAGIALLALAAGIVAGVHTSGSPSSADGDGLAPLQQKLTNTSVLPADFKTMPGFSLLDGDGGEITEAFLDDQWTMLFFGFTHCPDVCPITLSVMNSVVDKLDEQQTEPLQVAFVSVDPVRDTPEVMGRYVDFFNDEFVGITGELNDIHALTDELGIVASFTANEENPDNYTVDHTASMLLVDPQRRIRAKFNAPHEVDTIVSDYQTLLAALI